VDTLLLLAAGSLLALAALWTLRAVVGPRQRASAYIELALSVPVLLALYGLLFLSSVDAQQRVVLILQPPVEERLSGLMELDAPGLLCAALLLTSEAMGENAVQESQEDPFTDGCSLALESARLGGRIDDALSHASLLLERRPFWQKALDYLEGRSLRVVVLVRDPESWRQSQQRLDLRAHLKRLEAAGAQLLVATNRADQAPPWESQLQIALLSRRISREQRPELQFRLRLVGPPPKDALAVSCVLGGDCLGGASCPGGSACTAGACVVPCNAPSCEAPRPRFRFQALPAHVTPDPTPGGDAWLLSPSGSGPWTIDHFEPGELDHGREWIPLRCEVGTTQPHRVIATATTAVFVDAAKVPVISPGRGHLAPQAGSEPSLSDVNKRHRLFLYVTESAEPMGAEAARAMVFDDLSPEDWKSQCAVLKRSLETGVPTVVAGLSSQDICPGIDLGVRHPSRLRSVFFDRRPQLHVDFDRSRLGRFLSPPKNPGTPIVVAKLDASPSHDLLVKLQIRLIREAVHLAWELHVLETWAETPSEDVLAPRKEKLPTYEVFTPDSRLREAELLANRPDGDKTGTMLATSSIPSRLAALPLPKVGTNGLRRAGIQDSIVLFAYVHDQCFVPADVERAAEYLSWGANLSVIPIRLDFQLRKPECPLGMTAQDSLLGTLKRIAGADGAKAGPLGEQLQRRIMIWTGERFQPLSAGLSNASVEAAAVTIDTITTTATGLARHWAELLKPDRYRMRVVGTGRWIDERVLDPGQSESEASPAVSRGGAPLRFEALEATSGAARPLLQIAEGVSPQSPGWTVGLSTFSVAAPVLALGYSPLEGRKGDFRYPVHWRTDPGKRLSIEGQEDRFGPRRLVDAVSLWTDVRPTVTHSPRIEAVSYRDETIRLEVSQYLTPSKGEAAQSTALVVGKTGLSAGVKDCQGSPQRLRLAQILPDRSAFVFELPLGSRAELCGELSCRLTLCRAECAGANPPSDCEAADSFYVPAAKLPERRWADADVLEQLLALAHYSGGGLLNPAAPARSALRSRFLVALALSLATLWAMVVIARWLRTKRVAETAAQAAQRLRLDEVAATVREAGENLGHASPRPPAGPLATVRPMEAGDPLRNMVRSDFLAAAGLLSDVEGGLLPRVVERIREEPRRIKVVVNVGTSMRVPTAPGSPAPKLLGAARVAAAVSQIAWSGHAEVTLEAVGLGAPRIEGPHTVSPADQFVESFILDAARITGSPMLRAPLAADEGEAIVYVSDLLNESLPELSARIEDLQFDGSPVAVVHVYWPGEFEILESGLDIGSGMLVARGGHTPETLKREHEGLVRELRAACGEARGGLLVVAADIGAGQIVNAVMESDLGALLR
jgi:hypothetical protein